MPPTKRELGDASFSLCIKVGTSKVLYFLSHTHTHTHTFVTVTVIEKGCYTTSYFYSK